MQPQQMYTCVFENIPKKLLDYTLNICDELDLEITISREFLKMLNLNEVTFEVEHRNPDVINFAKYLIQQKIKQVYELENLLKLEVA